MTTENEAIVRKTFPGVEDIADQNLRSVVLRAWGRTISECEFERLEDIPFSVSAPGAGLVDHILWVLEASLNMASLAEERMGVKVNRDLLIAAVLLHDLGKAYEYRRAGEGFEKTEIGKGFMHGFWGAHVSILEGAPLELSHLISTHCFVSPVQPHLLEGVIMHYADLAHADIIMFQNNQPLFLAQKH
jgi:putative nucleotidyltransferase with HDIG domain